MLPRHAIGLVSRRSPAWRKIKPPAGPSPAGRMTKHERVPGSNDYYSSSVGGDGKVYLLSQRGHLVVVSAAGEWELLHQARFGEDVYATPALVDGRI